MWPEKPPPSLDQSSVKPVLKSEQFLILWTPQKRTEAIRLSIGALWCYLVKIHQCWKVHTDFRETCSPIQNTPVTGKPHIHQEDAKALSSAWPPPRRIQLLQSRPLSKWEHLAHETETTTKMLQDCRAARIVHQTTTGQNVSSRAAAIKLKNEFCFLRFHIWLLIKFNFATFENHCIQFFFPREFQLCWNWCCMNWGTDEQKKIYQFILLGWYSQWNFDFGQTAHCYFCYLNQFWWPASEK